MLTFNRRAFFMGEQDGRENPRQNNQAINADQWANWPVTVDDHVSPRCQL
jgi:hypothetical protein